MKWLQGLLKDPKESEELTPASADAPTSAGDSPESIRTPVSAAEAGTLDPSLSTSSPVPIESSPNGMGATEARPGYDLSPLLIRLDDLGVRQTELQQCFENRLRSAEVQGKIIERLHDELQQYKANFLRQALTPLLKEVIFCHDFVVQQEDKVRQGGNVDAGVAALEAIRQMLVDVLFKFDVEPFRREEDPETQVGAANVRMSIPFDPRTQQCLRTLPTDQPELDKRIAARGACGFRSGETILRRELVSVYKYSGSPRPAAGEPGPEGTVGPAATGQQAVVP